MSTKPNLKFEKYLCPGRDPYARSPDGKNTLWERREAGITDDHGGVIFKQPDVEVPSTWSPLALNVVASKYFYGMQGTDEREKSVRDLVHRVTRTIANWGVNDGYFSKAQGERFYRELASACLYQYGSFNSPVWFNVGLSDVLGKRSDSRKVHVWDEKQGKIIEETDAYKRPQASACFIQSVDDTMEDIMRLAVSEAMLFKYGSGTGTDLSTLRSSREKLSGGGTPSGPLSFMRVYDQVAAVIKSGGKTRRAAKMQSLRVSHPDIVEFIQAKAEEEKKACALIDAGYDGSFGGIAYDSVHFQNCNLSVRLPDEFMRAVESDGNWDLKAVRGGQVIETVKARELMQKIAEAAHACGDPGVQYDTTINKWNTCYNSGRINASNPCSEFMFLDNSACNLASVNLMKFIGENGDFDIKAFNHVSRLFLIAQDILVDRGSYPEKPIAENSHKFRPLGLGYANLGATLMRLGMPYDSDEARGFAAGVTALMTGQAYATSRELARVKGVFEGYADNREPMSRVLKMHREELRKLRERGAPSSLELLSAAETLWDEVIREDTGFRNAQVTLLAPTGTIGFMMDCDTTGVEPDIALVKFKKLAGGGDMKIINHTLRPALKRLGYNAEQIETIAKYVEEKDTIEGAPGLREEHLPVFDCAYKPQNGKRVIGYSAHLRMMAAIQPFLSGAISKTVSLPKDIGVESVRQTYLDAWKMGLKAVAIYRDGCKRTQPVSTGRTARAGNEGKAGESPQPVRRRMPTTRESITHKFDVAGHEGYLTVGKYEDGSPGELFITMAKEGSTIGGTMDSFGTAISLCLQYGVPIKELCAKFAHSRFEPSGFTKNKDIPIAKSIVDYIFRWLQIQFPNGQHESFPFRRKDERPESAEDYEKHLPRLGIVPDKEKPESSGIASVVTSDAPACEVCGSITFRNGACYKCFNCGSSTGCSG